MFCMHEASSSLAAVVLMSAYAVSDSSVTWQQQPMKEAVVHRYLKIAD